MFEVMDHPLFVWAKTCFELRGVKEIWTKWNHRLAAIERVENSASVGLYDPSTEDDDHGHHHPNGGGDLLAKQSAGNDDGEDDNPGRCSPPLWQPSATASITTTYSDLCAGLLLYACISYIDSKNSEADDAADFFLRNVTNEDPPISVLVATAAAVEENESDVVLGTNFGRRYERIRRRSSSSTTTNTRLVNKGSRTGEKSSISSNLDYAADNSVVCANEDVVAYRLRNLRAVMQRIRSFYAEALNALIVMPLPDILLIARRPFPEESGEEMKKVLLLLLGCAVQSDKKEEFIRKIKELDLGLQQAIVEQIKRVTDTVDCVLNVQALELDPSDRTTATVLHQLQRVIKERDCYANSTLDLASSSSISSAAVIPSEHESDGGGSISSSSTTGGGGGNSTTVTGGGHQSSSSSSSVCDGNVCQRKLPESQQDARENCAERHHLAVELADVKAKLRRARQELEEKIELASEYREELAEKEGALAKYRQENLDLLKDARSAKEYRDELDVLREKVDRLERLEQECGKYKERLTELDFYKSRVEELREENHLLLESKHMLENQVDSFNLRLQKGASAETELLQAQRIIIDLQQELKSEREKVGEMLEQNIQLEKECQESLNKSSALEKELSEVRTTLSDGDIDGHRSNAGPLSDQMNESANAKLLRLEVENQRLRSRLEETVAVSLVEQAKSENEKLRKQLEEAIQNNRECSSQQRRDLERNFRRLEEQYRREIDDLKTENTSLTNELLLTRGQYDDSLAEERKRVGAEYESNMAALSKDREELRSRTEELADDNKRVTQELARCKAALTRAQDNILENEKEKLAVENQLYALDRESRCAEKENSKLKKLLQSADEEFEKARTRILELEREKQKLESAQMKLDKAESAVVELEIEKRYFAQQSEAEMKKCTALREDLVKEKTQTHELKKSLKTMLHSLGITVDAEATEEEALHKAELMIHEYSCNSKREKEDFRSRVEEIELKRRQQNELISTQSTEIASLRQKLDTKNQDTRSNSEKLNELDVANLALSDENKNVKQQVYLLQDELRKLQNQGQAAKNENGLLRHEISELRLQMSSNAYAQADNAKLQVELRSLQLQVDVLEQDNGELQKQCNQWERDHALVRRDFEHLQRQHGGLLHDHEQLQTLHEQLTTDFEKVQSESVLLKSQLRQLKHDCSEHNDQLKRLLVEKERMSNLHSRFEQERCEQNKEFRTFALLQNEHSTLKKNYDDLKARYDFLNNEIDHMRSDYRNLRMDYNAVNLKATQLQAQLTDSQDFAQRKDLEAVKLLHKCDMLTQLNSTLEEESRTLLRQLDVLIAQNQSLLTRALMDKDQYHAESKEFQEKLNALRRHKEKLEEKIMEQYKSMDSPSKRHKEKLTFMKKAKALVSRPSTRKSRQKHSVTSGSAAEDSAMSADEGGFFSSSSRATDRYHQQEATGQYGNRLCYAYSTLPRSATPKRAAPPHSPAAAPLAVVESMSTSGAEYGQFGDEKRKSKGGSGSRVEQDRDNVNPRRRTSCCVRSDHSAAQYYQLQSQSDSETARNYEAPIRCSAAGKGTLVVRRAQPISAPATPVLVRNRREKSVGENGSGQQRDVGLYQRSSSAVTNHGSLMQLVGDPEWQKSEKLRLSIIKEDGLGGTMLGNASYEPDDPTVDCGSGGNKRFPLSQLDFSALLPEPVTAKSRTPSSIFRQTLPRLSFRRTERPKSFYDNVAADGPIPPAQSPVSPTCQNEDSDPGSSSETHYVCIDPPTDVTNTGYSNNKVAVDRRDTQHRRAFDWRSLLWPAGSSRKRTVSNSGCRPATPSANVTSENADNSPDKVDIRDRKGEPAVVGRAPDTVTSSRASCLGRQVCTEV